MVPTVMRDARRTLDVGGSEVLTVRMGTFAAIFGEQRETGGRRDG
jgi:hypothetical protein